MRLPFRSILVCFPVFLVVAIVSGAYSACAQGEISAFIFSDTAAIHRQLHMAKRIYHSGNTDSARTLFLVSLSESRQSLYYYGIVKSLTGLGNLMVNSGQYDQALGYYQRAEAACNSPTTRSLRATLWNNIGVVYGQKGQSAQSMTAYKKALQYARLWGSEIPLETLYSNLSIPLVRLGAPEKSLYYLQKAEPLAKKHQNYLTLANIYLNKGTVYYAQENLVESQHYFKAALMTARQHQFPDIQYSGSLNLGLIRLKQDRPEAAMAIFLKADTIRGAVSQYNRNKRLIFLGRAALRLKRYLLAERLLLRALDGAQALKTLKETVDIHELLSDLYVATGRYRPAFAHLQREKQLSDSMQEQKALRAVTQMELKYRSALKDREIARKKLTIDRQQHAITQRNVWIGGISGCLILLVGFVMLQKRSYSRRQRLKNEQVIRIRQQQEIEVMKAIMDGEEQERVRIAREIHDGIMIRFSVLKMNLSTLMSGSAAVVSKRQLRSTIDQLDEATHSLRRTAHNLMPDILLQEGLPEALFYFCDNLRKNAVFDISFHALGELPRFDPQFELSVYRMVQELIQNVVRHAAATQVIVQLSYERQLLSITVEDNGRGMNEKDRSGKGLGLSNIQARVAGFGGQMTMESREGVGTSVRLEFIRSSSQ